MWQHRHATNWPLQDDQRKQHWRLNLRATDILREFKCYRYILRIYMLQIYSKNLRATDILYEFKCDKYILRIYVLQIYSKNNVDQEFEKSEISSGSEYQRKLTVKRRCVSKTRGIRSCQIPQWHPWIQFRLCSSRNGGQLDVLPLRLGRSGNLMFYNLDWVNLGREVNFAFYNLD